MPNNVTKSQFYDKKILKSHSTFNNSHRSDKNTEDMNRSHSFF